jgi:hypothetical protein
MLTEQKGHVAIVPHSRHIVIGEYPRRLMKLSFVHAYLDIARFYPVTKGNYPAAAVSK